MGKVSESLLSQHPTASTWIGKPEIIAKTRPRNSQAEMGRMPTTYEIARHSRFVVAQET